MNRFFVLTVSIIILFFIGSDLISQETNIEQDSIFVEEESNILNEESNNSNGDNIIDEKKGIVTHLDGKVKKKLLDDESWDNNEEVVINGVVQSRESYKTMKKSRAELELAGVDIIRLAPKTTIDILALYEESFQGTNKTNVKLAEGELWAQINSADEDNEFEMDTDISAAAITGTNFRMTKDGDLTQMKVYHGEVKISNNKLGLNYGKPKPVHEYNLDQPKEISGPKEIAGPQEITLKEWIYVVKNMQQITFDSKGNVVSAGDFSSQDKTETTDWVQWNKIRDRQRGLK